MKPFFLLLALFSVSGSAFATTYEDFNQDWQLKTSTVGKCASALNLRHDNFFGQDSLIFNRVLSESALIQRIFKIGEEVRSDEKTVTSLAGDTISATTYTKGFLSNDYTKQKERTDFILNFPRLTYQESDCDGKIVTACEYEMKNPEFAAAPTSCSLYYNGSEVADSRCEFTESGDGNQTCAITTPVTIEDKLNGKYDVKLVYRNIVVSGVKSMRLNLDNYYKITYELDHIDDFDGEPLITKEKGSASFLPANERETEIHAWTDKNRLSLRCN